MGKIKITKETVLDYLKTVVLIFIGNFILACGIMIFVSPMNFMTGGATGLALLMERVAGKTEVMNVFEYEYETEDKEKKKQRIRFQWVSSIELTKRNLEEMILAGRGRWKIENEGFNNQKKGLYRIEHLNSKNSNAMKNHYLLTQISDILMQLYLAWNPYIKELKQTIKNTSSWLLESFRRLTVTEEDVSYIYRYTTVYLK